MTDFLAEGDVDQSSPEDVTESATIGRSIPRLRFEGVDDPSDPRKGYETELRFDGPHSALAPRADAAPSSERGHLMFGYTF